MNELFLSFFFRNLNAYSKINELLKKNEFKCLERDFGVAGADKVEQLLAVLADEGFLVAASDVVPLDAIVVKVVQDGQARLTLLLKT